MEQITSYIMAYLPSLTAIVTVIITVLQFIKKIKSIVGDTHSVNDKLTKAIAKRDEDIQVLMESTSKEIDAIKQSVKEKAKENAQLAKQNAELLAQNEKITALLDEVTTIKNQATTILEKRGE